MNANVVAGARDTDADTDAAVNSVDLGRCFIAVDYGRKLLFMRMLSTCYMMSMPREVSSCCSTAHQTGFFFGRSATSRFSAASGQSAYCHSQIVNPNLTGQISLLIFSRRAPAIFYQQFHFPPTQHNTPSTCVFTLPNLLYTPKKVNEGVSHTC